MPDPEEGVEGGLWSAVPLLSVPLWLVGRTKNAETAHSVERSLAAL